MLVPDLVGDAQARMHCRLELHAATDSRALGAWALKWSNKLDALLLEDTASMEDELSVAEKEAEEAENKAESIRQAVSDVGTKLDKAREEFESAVDEAKRAMLKAVDEACEALEHASEPGITPEEVANAAS